MKFDNLDVSTGVIETCPFSLEKEPIVYIDAHVAADDLCEIFKNIKGIEYARTVFDISFGGSKQPGHTSPDVIAGLVVCFKCKNFFETIEKSIDVSSQEYFETSYDDFLFYFKYVEGMSKQDQYFLTTLRKRIVLDYD